ncbi:MAG: 6-bladed beta-propeller [Candidatus Hydrothermales bacterium]
MNFLIFLIFIQIKSDIFWPPPPEDPKIKFEKFLFTKEDVVGETNIVKRMLNRILGVKKIRLFKYPFGIYVDTKERIWVADPGFSTIVFIDCTNKVVKWYLGSRNFRFIRPTGIAFSEAKNMIYVADPGAGVVFGIKFPEFEGSLIIKKGLYKPVNLTVDDYRNRLYVIDDSIMAIQVFNLDGQFLYTLGKKGNKPGEFLYPRGINIDRDGNVYVCEWGNFRVQILNTKGEVISVFGKSGNAPGFFVRPKGIAVDDKGFIFVTDAFLHRIQIFDKYGNVYLGIEGIGWDPGQFRLPAGIFVRNNKVYVVEQMNSRIQIFSTLY